MSLGHAVNVQRCFGVEHFLSFLVKSSRPGILDTLSPAVLGGISCSRLCSFVPRDETVYSFVMAAEKEEEEEEEEEKEEEDEEEEDEEEEEDTTSGLTYF